MPDSNQAAAYRELALLVRAGVGVEATAPELARVVRILIGAEGCFIGWFDDCGKPAGFFHDSAPTSAEELFLNNSHLFVGPDELNIFWLSRNPGQLVGSMLNPGKAFFKSNTFNLLFKACHHHHGLDLRVEVNGVMRLAIGLFRSKAHPFGDDDAHRLYALTPALQQAVVKTPGNWDSGFSPSGGPLSAASSQTDSGYLVVSPDGQSILMLDDQAARLIRLCRMFDQGLNLIGNLTAPPHFIRQLCQQLSHGETSLAQAIVDVQGGALVVTASSLQAAPELSAKSLQTSQLPMAVQNILVKVEFYKPSVIGVVQSISQLGLSPLQSRIAMFAATGGSRGECAAHHQISKEALKKHLREIYAAARCADWYELHRTLGLR